MSETSPARIRRALVAFAVLLSSIALATSLAPAAQGAANQITVFKHTGSQTASQYFSPTLNQPANFTKPANFENGRVYVKLDILSKPSKRDIIPQLCFWRHTLSQKFKFETCAITKKYAFTNKGTVWIDAGTPANWYKKNGKWDWSKQASLGRIMLKDVATGKLLLNERCGAACYKGDDLHKHVPVRMTAEVIFVAKGAQLAPPTNWRSGCPASWSSQCKSTGGAANPTPTPKPKPAPTPKPKPTPTPKPKPKPAPAPGETQPKITISSGNKTLNVNWSAVSGSKLSQFRYKQGGSGWKWDKPAAKRSRRVTGLVNGTTYKIQVRALVGGEWQAWATASAKPKGGSK